MAFNEQYYQDKLLKLEKKRQDNLQRFVNATFDFTNEASFLTEQVEEVKKLIEESKSTKEEPAKKTK